MAEPADLIPAQNQGLTPAQYGALAAVPAELALATCLPPVQIENNRYRSSCGSGPSRP